MSDEHDRSSSDSEKSRGIEGFLSFLRKLRRKVAADGLSEVMDELDREEQEGEHQL